MIVAPQRPQRGGARGVRSGARTAVIQV